MSEQNFKIVVLCGANSPEREVSINSGKACAAALHQSFHNVELLALNENALPANLAPETDIIFPVIHGDYGEDGRVQRDLDERGFSYAGCGRAASEICIDKSKTKKILRDNGVPVCEGIAFSTDKIPSAAEIVEKLGDDVVLKPADKGSSVGLFLTCGVAELQRVLAGDLSASKTWLAETRLRGRELTVGLLGGRAMGIVEIRPKVGVYDYKNKYTSGNTEYIFPAPLDNDVACKIKAAAEKAFAACGCRDFSRADVILLANGDFYFLEINTMPGLTGTSLLPKSASCVGLSFIELAKKMIEPAIARFAEKNSRR